MARLLVATGSKGKIYRVAGEPSETTLLVRAPAQQVTSMVQDAGGLLVSTANPGKVFRLSATPAATGSYESDVRDAESVATWGTISWRGTVPGGGDVKLFTRTGNSAAPDDTWSAWSQRLPARRGRADHQPESAVPAVEARAHRLERREPGHHVGDRRLPAAQSAAGDHVDHDSCSGRRVPEAVFVRRGGDCRVRRARLSRSAPLARRSAPATPLLGRRSYQKGLQTFVWKAQDANDDDLSYDIQYRREGETTWKVLKRNLPDPLLVWDTTSVPNGTYVIKVARVRCAGEPARRRAAWPSARATRSTSTTRRRSITVASVTRDNGRTTVRFTVKDADSPVQRVEYSIEADRWRPIYPKDGIADSRTEEFELVLDQDVGDRQIILRAFDTMNNVATTRAEAAGAAVS